MNQSPVYIDELETIILFDKVKDEEKKEIEEIEDFLRKLDRWGYNLSIIEKIREMLLGGGEKK